MALHRLNKIVLGVPDVDAAEPFYRDFGLEPLGNGRFATVDGGEQLELRQRDRRGLIELGVGCDDPDDLDRAAFDLATAGFPAERGDGYVLVNDVGSGVDVRVSVAPRYEQTRFDVPTPNAPGADLRLGERAPGCVRTESVRPRKLGHVVLGSVDVPASERLFLDALGFRVSDRVTNVGAFMRCSTDHHNLMVTASPAKFLHHTSWQVEDLDEVGRGASALIKADPSRHSWGMGRHNVGSNFFWYVKDPAGNLTEYYSDLDIITDELAWQVGEWDARHSIAAWGPRPPKGFFAPDDVAEMMMSGHSR